ncbi:MAG: Uncharacterised protein [Methanobacteriota archaeon]|nr:MAG: Uncharacterised protein [Euryarchaeota archaeon]
MSWRGITMRTRVVALVMILFITIFMPHSNGEIAQEETYCDLIPDLQFDGEAANDSVKFQTSLGPRTPNSNASYELRESIKENLTGWEITESVHYSEGYLLTNLFARWNAGAGSTVILAAHYDTRDRADQDPNESRRGEPILGANDGASGVAVLLELAKIIPSMNLSHEIMLFFTDGEDQGNSNQTPSYALGAKAWSENLSKEEAESFESFILVDMVGDIELNLKPTWQGNATLWDRTTEMAVSLGIDNQRPGCDGENGSGVYESDSNQFVFDDHVFALQAGIPAIDIIDISYGVGAPAWGGHWHTVNDTADKVSADSLSIVGRLVELGLRSGAWTDVEEPAEEIPNEPENIEQNDPDNSDLTSDEDDSNQILLISAWLVVFCAVMWIIFADKRGEG